MNLTTRESSGTSAVRLGFWTATLTAGCATAALALGVATPPRSGPNCRDGCIPYPYTDGAAFVPRDYLWMYPAFLMAAVFVALVLCIHHRARGDQQVWSGIGLCFAAIAAAVLTTGYFIQLAVMQPSLLKGETEGLTLFSQYNPHGVFIALEDLGYLMVGVALLFTGVALVGSGAVERAVRWLFIVGGLAAIGALIGLSLIYGQDLEYRYEVIVIGIDWTALIVGGVLLSILFRRAGHDAPHR